MGFNKKWLPEYDVLLAEYQRVGHDEFRRTYMKYDAFFGLSEEKDIFLKHVMEKNEKWEVDSKPKKTE